MPRFVILEHSGSPRTFGRVHWDLLLEIDAADASAPLRAWELAALPSAGAECDATPLPDHRPMYLEFDGPLSGGRGWVRRVVGGSYVALEIGAERWVLRLDAPERCGTLTLARQDPADQRWRASFRES